MILNIFFCSSILFFFSSDCSNMNIISSLPSFHLHYFLSAPFYFFLMSFSFSWSFSYLSSMSHYIFVWICSPLCTLLLILYFSDDFVFHFFPIFHQLTFCSFLFSCTFLILIFACVIQGGFWFLKWIFENIPFEYI